MVTGGVWLIWNGANAVAALYGGACAMTMTALLGRKVKKLNERWKANEDQAPRFGAADAAGFVPRFLFILAAFAFGIGALKLHPVSLLITYAIVHLAYLFSLRSPAANHKN